MLFSLDEMRSGFPKFLGNKSRSFEDRSVGDSIRNSPFQTGAKSVKVEEFTERGKQLHNLPILSP